MKDKLIRDSIHGYIEIPEVIVNKIIDTPVFQRLRQIEQTSMRALYPSAHHDRFVHSIGVYHLGKLAFRGLINNIKEKEIYKENELFWKQYGICFELACLLHDCAHAPMSHSFEYAYFKADDPKDCKEKEKRLIRSMTYSLDDNRDKNVIEQCKKDVASYFSKPQKIAPHEMVSAILVSEYFARKNVLSEKGVIYDVLKELLSTEIADIELSEYVIFIQRAIIGLPYSSIESSDGKKYLENCFKNCLISLLNGNFFDVDKLDYIIRDTVESGANNISIDIPRILNALTLVEIHQFEKETEVEKLELNNSIYFSGCDSNFTDRGENSDCECALNLYGVRMKGQFQGLMELDDNNNKICTPDSEGHRSGRSRFNDMTDVEAEIQGYCKLTGRFNGQIQILNQESTNKIDGLINAIVSGKITGEIVGNIVTDIDHKLIYKVGYLKNAISVIEDTLIARNRLYLWIYAHHKVTYHDYILRQGILRSFIDEESADMEEYEKKQKANDLLYKTMSIDDMFFADRKSKNYLLNDGDLIHQMKMSLMSGCGNNHYAKQWFSRSHMHPVWKSYAEYNSFFANLSSQQRKRMWELLFADTIEGCEEVFPNESNTMEFESSILNEFSDSYEYTWIKPAGFKLKEMDVSNIYVVLSDESVKRLKDVMTQEKVTEQYVDESFFYLYTSEPLSSHVKLQLISYLKKAVKEKKR